MASWVIRADNEGCAYTLGLPNGHLDMADGAQQLADAMLLLAIYPGVRRDRGPALSTAPQRQRAVATTAPLVRRFGRRQPALKPVNAIADPDLRARRFTALLAVASSQAANVTSVNTPILIAGARLCCWPSSFVSRRRFIWRTLLMLATIGAGVLVFNQYGKLFARDSGIALLFILVRSNCWRPGPPGTSWWCGARTDALRHQLFENLGPAGRAERTGGDRGLRDGAAPVRCTRRQMMRAAVASVENTIWRHACSASGAPGAGHSARGDAFFHPVFRAGRCAAVGHASGHQRQRTGLSEEMRPGPDCATSSFQKRLHSALNSTNAGRLSRRFYWRGPVLREFDGKTWGRWRRERCNAHARQLHPVHARRTRPRSH